jgi:hypothetical protein
MTRSTDIDMSGPDGALSMKMLSPWPWGDGLASPDGVMGGGPVGSVEVEVAVGDGSGADVERSLSLRLAEGIGAGVPWGDEVGPLVDEAEGRGDAVGEVMISAVAGAVLPAAVGIASGVDDSSGEGVGVGVALSTGLGTTGPPPPPPPPPPEACGVTEVEATEGDELPAMFVAMTVNE